MIKKGGLGRGLGALINENLIDDPEDDKNKIKLVSINDIRPNDEQPRKSFDNEKLATLAESIKQHGIIQPLVLMKKENIYVIVAGERRWRAAKLIGLKEIPSVIMDLNNSELLEVSLIENIQREDLNPIEEANAYKKLLEDFKLTQEVLGKRIGKSRTVITNAIRLLNLDIRVQGYLIDGVITEGHAKALLGVEDNNIQYELAQKIIDEGLSVRQIEKIIKEIQAGKKKNNDSKDEKIDSYITDIRNRLEEMFGTKVNLKNNKNKGKIEIEYYSNDDLQRIIDILKI